MWEDTPSIKDAEKEVEEGLENEQSREVNKEHLRGRFWVIVSLRQGMDLAPWKSLVTWESFP